MARTNRAFFFLSCSVHKFTSALAIYFKWKPVCRRQNIRRKTSLKLHQREQPEHNKSITTYNENFSFTCTFKGGKKKRSIGIAWWFYDIARTPILTLFYSIYFERWNLTTKMYKQFMCKTDEDIQYERKKDDAS